MTDTSFADEVQAAMPPGLALPDEFRRLFDWMEPNGFVQAYRSRPERYAALYPGQAEEGRSIVTFVLPDPAYVCSWLGTGDPALTNSLAAFVRTGGDGSRAGLWRDGAGRQHFVHLGSEGDQPGVLVGGPVDMLRFLTIGYIEACWPDDFDRTPQEAAAAATRGKPPQVVPPAMFQDWVRDSFGVTIPARASEIVTLAPGAERAGPADPFRQWLDAIPGR